METGTERKGWVGGANAGCGHQLVADGLELAVGAAGSHPDGTARRHEAIDDHDGGPPSVHVPVGAE